MKLKNRLYRQQHRYNHSLGIYRDRENNVDQQHQKVTQIELEHIQASLQIMNIAFRNNLKIQQVYLDLIKAKNRKVSIKTKDIKNVYEILSENKADQLSFEKVYQQEEKQRKSRQEQFYMTASLNNTKFKDIASAALLNKTNKVKQPLQNSQKQTNRNSQNSAQNKDSNNNDLKLIQNELIRLVVSSYRRLYSRLIEAIVRKITYYILNKHLLQKLVLHVVSQISKKLQILIRRLNDLKDSKFLFEVVKIIYEENFIIQQKIYQTMVDEGHVVSLDEFFRVNGILLQQADSIKRNSRMSVISNTTLQRFSIMSKDSSRQDKKKDQQSKFLQNNKKLKDIKNLRTEKNIMFIQRVNKQIQTKYAQTLSKLGDLISFKPTKSKNQRQSQNSNQNSNIQSENQSNSQSQQQQNEIVKRFQRSKKNSQQKNSSMMSRSRVSNFQYFSPQFRQVIRDLDEKKGRTFVVSTSRADSFSSMRKSKTMMGLQSQFQKINKDTISLQNPINVARVLNKKFSQFSPKASQFSYMSRTGNNKKSQNNKTQINKLLKIYQNKQKQNHVIDILFNCSIVDDEHKQLQKNFIKLNILSKLKQKRSSWLKQLKQQGRDSVFFQQNLMREIQAEYERILGMRLKGNKGITSFEQSQQLMRSLQENIMNSLSINKKRKAVDLQKQGGVKFITQLTENINHGHQNYLSPLNNSRVNKKDIAVGLSERQNKHVTKTQNEVTKSNNLRQVNRPNLQHNQNLQSHRSKDMKQLKKYQIYGQFSNPLTRQYGYYNQRQYSTMRNSLQRCQENSILLKKGILKQNTFQIRSKVAFWDKIRPKLETTKQVINNNINICIKEQKGQNILRQQKQLSNFSKVFKQNNKNISSSGKQLSTEVKLKNNNKLIRNKQNTIFEHKLLQKFINDNPLFAQEDLNLDLPQQQSQGLPIVRSSFKKYKDSSLQKSHYLVNLKSNSSQRPFLGRDFCLNSVRINNNSQQILSCDDLDMMIERYMQRKSKGQMHTKQYKIQTSVPSCFQSLESTPRNSFKRVKQIYSTQRRLKVQ